MYFVLVFSILQAQNKPIGKSLPKVTSNVNFDMGLLRTRSFARGLRAGTCPEELRAALRATG